MINILRLTSYVSLSLILLLGILLLSGYIQLLSWNYRLGIGSIVILYVLVRGLMIYRSRRQGKKP